MLSVRSALRLTNEVLISSKFVAKYAENSSHTEKQKEVSNDCISVAKTDNVQCVVRET